MLCIFVPVPSFISIYQHHRETICFVLSIEIRYDVLRCWGWDPKSPMVPTFQSLDRFFLTNEPAHRQALYVCLLGDLFSSGLKLYLLSSYHISMFTVTDSSSFFWLISLLVIANNIFHQVLFICSFVY